MTPGSLARQTVNRRGSLGNTIHGPAIIMLKSGAGNAICFQPGFNQDFFNEGPRRPIAGAPLMNARMPHGRHEPVHDVICVFQKKSGNEVNRTSFSQFFSLSCSLFCMFSILHEREQQHVPRSCLSVYVSAELLGRERQQTSSRARRSTRNDEDELKLHHCDSKPAHDCLLCLPCTLG